MNNWCMNKGYNKDEAILEASKCLSCKNPRCETGCPTNMRIRDFIKNIKEDNLSGAYDIIRECSSLPHICSIVCPVEKQCVGHCVLGIKGKPINCNKLERYVLENVFKKQIKKNTINKRVAVIGTGPAGIACALELAKNGYYVEMFEEKSYFGGVLAYGIPNYRLDYNNVLKSLNELKELNVVINYNKKMLESDIINLKNTFDYVFISTGLTKSKKLGIKNENITGVINAFDYLVKVNEDIKLHIGNRPIFKGDVVVVGAGNVAMDAARCAKRDGANVKVVYRRSIDEAPATKEEIKEAMEEGIIFKFLNNPVEVIGIDNVCGIVVEQMALGELDSSGRRKPTKTGVFDEIKCDYVISAIGQEPDDIYDKNELKTDYKYLVCDNFKTNIDGIYAGGDIVLGAKTVVEAMVCGRKVSKMIIKNDNI